MVRSTTVISGASSDKTEPAKTETPKTNTPTKMVALPMPVEDLNALDALYTYWVATGFA